MKTKNLLAAVLFVATSLANVFAQTNGTLLWSTDVQYPIQYSSPALSSDGRLFIASASNFTSLNLQGDVLWQVPLNIGQNIYYYLNTPVVDRSTVYVRGVLNATLGTYGFNFSGQTNWMVLSTGQSAIGTNGDIFLFRSALNRYDTNGTLVWSSSTIDDAEGFPVIDPAGNIYAGSYHASVYGFNPDGTKKWTNFIGSLWNYSPALDANGNIYGGGQQTGSTTYRQSLISINSSNGVINWLFDVSTNQVKLNAVENSPVIGKYGIIYCATTNGTVFALNPNGTKRWQFSVGSAIHSSPALADDGTLYFGSDNGKLNAIIDNGTNALWKWTYQTGGPIYSSPTIDATGVVYIGSDDGKLYALQGSAPLAKTAWPMFRHDPQHTACMSKVVRTPAQMQTQLSNGVVNITVNGEWGQRYQIEASTDLAQWTTVTNVANTNGSFNISGPANATTRFYRISTP